MKPIDPAQIAKHINHQSSMSIAEQVANLIEMWTASRTIGEGDLFPSVRDLSEGLGIAHKTAHRVQELLKERGLVEKAGNRMICAGITPTGKAAVRKKYEESAIVGILALRESGCSKARAAAIVERAYEMERGPYAAV